MTGRSFGVKSDRKRASARSRGDISGDSPARRHERAASISVAMSSLGYAGGIPPASAMISGSASSLLTPGSARSAARGWSVALVTLPPWPYESPFALPLPESTSALYCSKAG